MDTLVLWERDRSVTGWSNMSMLFCMLKAHREIPPNDIVYLVCLLHCQAWNDAKQYATWFVIYKSTTGTMKLNEQQNIPS